MTRFFLALITALALAVPAKAQIGGLTPEIPDSVYFHAEGIVHDDPNADGQAVRRFIGFNEDPYTKWLSRTNVRLLDTIIAIDNNFAPDHPKMGVGQHLEHDEGYPIYFFAHVFPYTNWYGVAQDVKNAELTKTLAVLDESAKLVINSDTLAFSDARHCLWHGIDTIDFVYFSTIYPLILCWPADALLYEEGDVVEFQLLADEIFPVPRAATDLRAWKDLRTAGSVWLSWTLPTARGGRDVVEQLAAEAEDRIYYEYKALRDGDNEWKTIFLDETLLGSVITVENRPRQRRRYRVNGLDPHGEYSFCVRAVGRGGAGKETCTLDRIYPTSAETSELPQQTELHQNYPNPFNPSTAIEYELATPQHVRLDVFDATGRTVKVLANGMRPAGTHTVTFDAYSLPSGLYVYRLQAGGKTITRKMTLVK